MKNNSILNILLISLLLFTKGNAQEKYSEELLIGKGNPKSIVPKYMHGSEKSSRINLSDRNIDREYSGPMKIVEAIFLII